MAPVAVHSSSIARLGRACVIECYLRRIPRLDETTRAARTLFRSRPAHRSTVGSLGAVFVRPVRRAAFVHEFSAEKRGDDATSEAPSAPRRGRVFVLHGPTVRAVVAHEHLGIGVPHDESASFPGAMEPFEPRPATHAGRELHTSRGKMRCDRGKERSASRRVARENALGVRRREKTKPRKYAEVCFKSPPRRRRRLPIDKSAWYVAGNKRSVDSAAYWWGIKPHYPTAPVPSRIRAEKTTTKEPKSGRKNDGVRRRGIETHPRASRGRRFAATPPSTSPEG